MQKSPDNEPVKKFHGGRNLSNKSVIPNARKLDETTDVLKHDHVTREFRVELQAQRANKGMTQKQLAEAINEKVSVVNEYESGKAIPNGQVIQKLNKALGCTLPKARPPPPKKAAQDE
eukprot:Filipodium_phascolosomae@DN3338_c0_g1_i1.p1